MKKVFEPKDLGLEDSFVGRGDIAGWIYDICLWKCSNCGAYATCKPSHYCSDCGSMMVNAVMARKEYQKQIDKINKVVEEKEDDIQRD